MITLYERGITREIEAAGNYNEYGKRPSTDMACAFPRRNDREKRRERERADESENRAARLREEEENDLYSSKRQERPLEPCSLLGQSEPPGEERVEKKVDSEIRGVTERGVDTRRTLVNRRGTGRL